MTDDITLVSVDLETDTGCSFLQLQEVFRDRFGIISQCNVVKVYQDYLYDASNTRLKWHSLKR